MRNQKAYHYGYDVWNASFSARPYNLDGDCTEWDDCDLEEDYDYSSDMYWYDAIVFKNKEFCTNKINTTNKDYIKYKLSQVKLNSNCRHLFEDIIAGNFCISVNAETIANKYFINNLLDYANFVQARSSFPAGLQINIYEISSDSLNFINPYSDERFNMTKWVDKFESKIENQNFLLDDLVNIISHCIRIERAKSFY